MNQTGLSKAITTWLQQQGTQDVAFWKTIILLGILVAASLLVFLLTRFLLVRIGGKVVKHTKAGWDDVIFEKRVFNAISYIIPALLIEYYSPTIFAEQAFVLPAVMRVTDAFIILVSLLVLVALLNSFRDIMADHPTMKEKPIGSFVQLSKILIYFVFGIWMISVLVGKSPLVFFSAMGAMTAVLLLVFKDTILGFVASIQLSANDMVQVGDWVSMPKYGADGDVVEINLATVKVQNFDKTITTIPTYSFISDSFKNWRGMEASEGRRIKRAVNIRIKSIKFVDDALLEKLQKYQRVHDYLEERQQEIEAYNKEHKADKSVLVNGRHMTNIGVFRKYVEAYLASHPFVNQDMTTMVRQLEPGPEGLPIEIYCFSNDKEWVNYENIQADMFDHILAVVPLFELEVFENPTGDFSMLKAHA